MVDLPAAGVVVNARFRKDSRFAPTIARLAVSFMTEQGVDTLAISDDYRDPDTPPETPFGPVTDGVKIRVRPANAEFGAGVPLTFYVQAVNASGKPVCWWKPGRGYGTNVIVELDGKALELPKEKAEYIGGWAAQWTVKETQDWTVTLPENTQISEGRHTLRYIIVSDGGTYMNANQQPIPLLKGRILSNTATFTIMPAQPASASATQPAASAPAVGGKLSIAEHANQIGVIANRSIEENGRVVKIIYYRLSDPAARPPYKESDLVQAGVKTFTYDADGRVSRSETTELTSVMPIEETRRNEDGSLRDITWSHGSGNVSHRNIYRGNTCVTELHYNVEGAVGGIRGEVPPDHDLPAWGKPVDDVACAALTSRARGTFAGLGLWITARNTGKQDRKIVTIGKARPEFLVEVRRADGTLVQQDPQYVKCQFERRQAGNPNEKDVAQTLATGRAELVAWGRELSHWYADLLPGKYQVTVTCRSGDEFNLVSNTAAFEIVPADTKSPAAAQTKE